MSNGQTLIFKNRDRKNFSSSLLGGEGEIGLDQLKRKNKR
jgi:hypothetical protein